MPIAKKTKKKASAPASATGDAAPDTKPTPAPPPPAKPKTKFSGRYRVLTQIKFMAPTGKVRTQLPYSVTTDAEGNPQKAAAFLQCPGDLTEEQANDFFAKGCIEPAFE